VKRASLLLLLALNACKPAGEDVYQGYAEGEYLRMAPEAPGRLMVLAVARGDRVHAGDLLFQLDDREAVIARDQAAANLAEASARLADLAKGGRPPEIAAIEATLSQAQAQLAIDMLRLKHRDMLRASGNISAEERDIAAAAVATDQAKIAEAKARIETAKMAGREDMLAAAAAVVAADQAKLAESQRQLAERRVMAPADAVVDDTLYRLGEEVMAGSPVVSLLPPENIKIRFFLPEPVLGRVHVGDKVALACDSCPGGVTATIGYIAPQAEFTPPVIYSATSRDKLVYLIEARPDREPASFHPGQPVDVRLVGP
jgi:HlyD family secretion protein